jgi:hypothetical protein
MAISTQHDIPYVQIGTMPCSHFCCILAPNTMASSQTIFIKGLSTHQSLEVTVLGGKIQEELRQDFCSHRGPRL